mmetsp:Transcript_28788/g.42950  ORF Transcript_28788/g.42950 Transcript_28788/m.42950 type:complete len:551 (+) Transcript_28788:123-1775(+)
MKGLKAAAFVQLNDHHVMNNNCHGRRVINISSRHHQPIFVNDAASLMSFTRRRRRHQSSLPIQSTKDDNNNGDENYINANGSNGIFLDLDTYLQAEETLLRPDGSLSGSGNQILQNEAYQSAVMQGLFPPTYSYPDTKLERDLSDEELLLRSVTDIQNDKSSLTQQQQQVDAETLHQQVFAEEQVYLEQSEDFRKSLSNNLQSNGDSFETPMARGRREAVEEYNQEILSDLLREIEEMEAGAISREDALSRAKTSGSFIDNDDDNVIDVKSSTGEEGASAAGRPAFCSQCGLTVTPDMLQRAKYGPQKLLCQACYGVKFRIKDEADVRLAPGPSIWESNRMFDQRKKSESRRRRLDKSRMNRGSVLDTSSLFRIPDSRMPNDLIPDDISEATPKRVVEIPTRAKDSTKASSFDSGQPPTENKPTEPARTVETTKPIDSGRGSSRSKEGNDIKPSTSNVSTKQQRRPTSSRLLGGRELERRKTQQKSDEEEVGTDLPSSFMEQQRVEDVIVEEEAALEKESSNKWIKVEDSTTKRIMYWNKETGEMKRSID